MSILGSILGGIFDILSETSTGKNKTHTYKGKSGTYLKKGGKRSGRKGKTISYKASKK